MKEKLKQLQTIHIALCVGIAFAYFMLGNLHTLDFLQLPKMDSSTYLYILIPVAAVVLGNFLYKQQLKGIDPQLKLEEKYGTYHTACIVRWALLEGGALIILFLEPKLIILGLLLVLYMAFLRPSEEAMKKDLSSSKL